jgi:hypothetical protein
VWGANAGRGGVHPLGARSGAEAAHGGALFAFGACLAQAALQAAFFLVPGTDPDAAATPAWSAVASSALALAGVALFKWWEAAQGDDTCDEVALP